MCGRKIMDFERIKKQGIHYIALVLAIVFLTTPLSNLLIKYISFVGTFLLKFISMFIILVVSDLLLHKFYLKGI